MPAGTAVNFNYLRGAASASTSNRVAATINLAASGPSIVGAPVLLAVANGDTLSVNLAAADAAPGMIWCNVLEF